MTAFEVRGNDSDGWRLVDLSDGSMIATYTEQPAVPDDIVDDLLEELQVGDPQKTISFGNIWKGRSSPPRSVLRVQ
jgi:hypothetical protein